MGMSAPDPPNRASAGRGLALGWAAAVAMWAIAYVALMRPGFLIGEALFALMLLCPALTGFVAGRDEALQAPVPAASRLRGFRIVLAGAKVGLVTSLVNLLIIGSLLIDPVTHQLHAAALWWIGGNFIITIALAAIGAVIAAAWPLRGEALLARGTIHWFWLFTRVAAVAVALLLITGGLVTGLRAGLAVPDWPGSFGHNMLLYPLAQMTGGIYYEHAHRLYGMLVGLTAITLAVALFIFDHRLRLRLAGIVILLMVCGQGLMGGLRVTETNTPLAIVHGVFGQVVFAAVVAVAAVTSRTWLSDRAAQPNPRAGTERFATALVLVLLILQIALGALYRHLRREADDPGAAFHHLLAHIVMALLVIAAIIFAAGRAWAFHGQQPILRRLGKGLIHLLLLQLVFGVVATILVLRGRDSEAAPYEVALTTAHQFTGALLLAWATMLALWTRRLLSDPLSLRERVGVRVNREPHAAVKG